MTLHPLDALGNPVRRAILLELRDRPLSVVELTERFAVSRPAVSRHLAVLLEAGLVEVEAVGSQNLYSVRVSGFASVRSFLDDFWDMALSRLQKLAKSKK